MDLETIVVSHGAEELLRRCLRSLEEHPASGQSRVTVVDSGSTDATPDMVEREFLIEGFQTGSLRDDHFVPFGTRRSGVEAFPRHLFCGGGAFGFARLNQ